MSDNVIGLPQRGKTYLSGPNRTPGSTYLQSKAIEGIRKTFKDLDYSANPALPRSGGSVRCTLVRNASGIALLPGRVCIWKAGAQGKQVDGYSYIGAEGTSQVIAGVVDEWLPAAGVANNDLFWLVQTGPCLVRKSLDANALAQNDWVTAITAATSQATTAGRIISLLQTSNATQLGNQALNRLGIAMSTSGTTNANVLVYLDLPG